MPAKFERCVKKVIRKGHNRISAYAICVKSTGWRRGKGGKWVKKGGKKNGK